jgi:hypothetical protein
MSKEVNYVCNILALSILAITVIGLIIEKTPFLYVLATIVVLGLILFIINRVVKHLINYKK